MNILITTDFFHRIEQELLFTLEDSGYRLIIHEIGPTIQAIQNEQIPLHHSFVGKMDSNGEVASFEDLDDKVEVEHSMAQRNFRLRDSPINVMNKGVEKWTPGLLENSNSKKRSEGSEDRMEDNIEDDSNSCSRTKIVSFCQNSHSEEVYKLSQHL